MADDVMTNDDRKRELVQLRASTDDVTAWKAEAKKRGMPLSKLVRTLMNRHVGAMPVPAAQVDRATKALWALIEAVDKASRDEGNEPTEFVEACAYDLAKAHGWAPQRDLSLASEPRVVYDE